MALEITWERHDGIAIAILAGRVDGSATDELQDRLESGIGTDDRVLILDFAAVSYINSSGLRVGLKLAKQCKESGRKFGLCSLTDATREIVAISGFDQVIPVYESRKLALSQVSPD